MFNSIQLLIDIKITVLGLNPKTVIYIDDRCKFCVPSLGIEPKSKV